MFVCAFNHIMLASTKSEHLMFRPGDTRMKTGLFVVVNGMAFVRHHTQRLVPVSPMCHGIMHFAFIVKKKYRYFI